MKLPYHTLLSAIAALISVPVSASELSVSSRIEAVSLFRDGARITRSAEIEVPAGRSTLLFANLPSHVDGTALQAELGRGAGVIRNAKIYQPIDQDDSPAVEALKQKLEEHLQKKRAVQESIDIAKENIAFVESMSESFAKGYGELSDNGATHSIEQGIETWKLVAATRREALEATEEGNAQLRVLAKEEELIRRDLRDAQEKQNLTRSVAEIELDMDQAQSIEIALHYQALSARWFPQYELRAVPAESQLEFGYLASIWQKTGEDWNDAELTLHTNQAGRSGNVPELDPMHLEHMEVIPMQAPMEKSMRTEVYELRPFSTDSAQTLDYAASAPPPSRQRVSIAATTASFQVKLPSRVNVPSADESTLLPLTTANFETEFWSEAVPKLQLEAYLRAEATNSLDLPILPGTALSFVDGALSSKVQLPKTLPGESLELSLGIDPNIVVKRIEGAQEDKNAGFIDKTVKLARSFNNTVTSYHTRPHKVVVVDQFPIATDAKIEITRLAPKSSEIIVEDEDKDNGIFHWEASIQPEESLSFRTEYEVEHPRDWQIVPQP